MVQIRSFYTFTCSWFKVFEKMVDRLKSSADERFSIWAPKDKTREKLLIIMAQASVCTV
jgi:hypothetical protein